MSNKPKIYSFCNAGCKWPTVHEDDFISAATYIEKPVDLIREGKNVHYLEIGKQYKIKAPKSDVGYHCSITFEFTMSNENYSTDTLGLITIPNTDKYADSFVFKLLEVVHDSDNELYLIYERSGVRIKESISGYSDPSMKFSFKENNLYVVGADEVYEYNSEANYSISYSFDENVELVERERQKSKNLFNINAKRIDTNATASVSGNVLTVSNIYQHGYTIYKIPVKPYTDYTVYADVDIITSANATGKIAIFDETVTTFFNQFYPSNNITTGTFKTGDYTTISLIFYSNSSTEPAVGKVSFSNIQLEEGSQATDYQAYNGAIVHEKQLRDGLLPRELLFGEEYSRVNITQSSLTTLQEYFDLFYTDISVNYVVSLGRLSDIGENTSNFKNLVGNPFATESGEPNYVNCHIKLCCTKNINKRYGTFELFAINNYGTNFAKGYIHRNANGEVNFTGWEIVGG